MPQIEVRPMLIDYQCIEFTGARRHLRRLVPPPRRLFLQTHNMCRIHHQQSQEYRGYTKAHG
jgi:hypothetical protein